ncbi:protein phosphatase 1 regulatory subunit 1B isoform X2 [Pangasianodon hypophthalmus]|uniref:protein phosphatase 1 regulatory subunit 1B isoform X2 n=1 Tax=Pangasianodon hypophthalmus TaxID=310915 RepID=UPI001481A5DC|nr:protein phosphatase 1 regulatory subunit 1B isoform X2 [Pangasianodon hypophthalmus]
MEGEIKEGRKIQFSVPSAGPIQLDPRQVEMIRRRRPTPATLFCMTDHPSPEEENPSFPLFVCENGVSKSQNIDMAIYQPPSLKAVQKMAQAHIKSSDTPSSESSDNEDVSLDAPRATVPPDEIKSEKTECPLSSGRLGEEEKGKEEAENLRAESTENRESEEKGEE